MYFFFIDRIELYKTRIIKDRDLPHVTKKLDLFGQRKPLYLIKRIHKATISVE